MATIKLSEKQNKNLKTAITREQQTAAVFRQAQAQAQEAANHRLSILEMIFEAHGVEMPADGVKINISDAGVMTFSENGKASDRIKKAVSRGPVKTPKKAAKVVPLKTSK